MFFSAIQGHWERVNSLRVEHGEIYSTQDFAPIFSMLAQSIPHNIFILRHLCRMEPSKIQLNSDSKAKEAEIIQPEIGLDSPSYEDCLRETLRRNPDLIVSGEIRHAETAVKSLIALSTVPLRSCRPALSNRYCAIFCPDHPNDLRRCATFWFG
jgi:Type II/IV secretion system protein